MTETHCQWGGVLNAQSITVVLGSNTILTGGTRITTRDDNATAMEPNTITNDVAVIRIPYVTFSDLTSGIFYMANLCMFI